MTDADLALRLADTLLSAELPDRWRHVLKVVERAREVSVLLSSADQDTLLASAALHDVGYSPTIAVTGFHPLDGARYASAQGFSHRICSLVAHHSCASLEALMRDVPIPAVYEDEQTVVRDVLWFCDASTGPQGQPMTPDERWTEIRNRYGPDHLVSRFLKEAEPELRAAIQRIEKLMEN